MFNFASIIKFRFLLICCLQAFTSIYTLESSSIVFEHHIDSEAIMNDNNVANQIDRFLDIGLEYQKTTGKNLIIKFF